MPDVTVPPKVLPVTPENYPAEIPTFASEADERDFWDTHDSDFYFSQGVDASLEPDPPNLVRRTESSPPPPRPSRWTGQDFPQLVIVRFTTSEFERVSTRAEQEGVSVEDLLHKWITRLHDADSEPTDARETA